MIVNDTDLLPPAPRKFSNQLDNNFCVPLLRKRLREDEYAQQKSAYMATGDARMVLFALNHKDSDPVIITEETSVSNDGKLFKKLPSICDILEIRHQTVAEWLSAEGVVLSWSHPEIN